MDGVAYPNDVKGRPLRPNVIRHDIFGVIFCHLPGQAHNVETYVFVSWPRTEYPKFAPKLTK